MADPNQFRTRCSTNKPDCTAANFTSSRPPTLGVLLLAYPADRHQVHLDLVRRFSSLTKPSSIDIVHTYRYATQLTRNLHVPSADAYEHVANVNTGKEGRVVLEGSGRSHYPDKQRRPNSTRFSSVPTTTFNKPSQQKRRQSRERQPPPLRPRENIANVTEFATVRYITEVRAKEVLHIDIRECNEVRPTRCPRKSDERECSTELFDETT
ncbi:hypothetical protein CBL_04538 [Carabus blaptoides fortunei]